MKRVSYVLCRHTQVDLNAQHKYTGQLDVPLNAVGERQAENLGRQLSHMRMDAIFSSDLVRAVQTANKVGAYHPLVIPQTDPRLREVHLGRLNGMHKDEVKRLYPDAKYSTRSPNFDFREVGGESRTQVIQRYEEFFDATVARLGVVAYPPTNIVVVGHGTALRIFLENLGVPCTLEQGNYQIITYPN
jgi:probable phosphoglycerate mutase